MLSAFKGESSKSGAFYISHSIFDIRHSFGGGFHAKELTEQKTQKCNSWLNFPADGAECAALFVSIRVIRGAVEMLCGDGSGGFNAEID